MTGAEVVLSCTGVAKQIGARTVLRDLDFALRVGELALVRASRGAGKTTLAKLLCGQTDPNEGRILRRSRPAPLIGSSHGFQPGAPALRGLDIRAAAHGVESSAYVLAVASFMEDPNALRRPFSEIVGRDRAMLLFASSWLLPSAVYVADGSPLPNDPEMRERLWPLYEAARARGGIVWITDERSRQGPFLADSFYRLAGGTLASTPPEPRTDGRIDAARADLDRKRAALRVSRERLKEAERTNKAALREKTRELREQERQAERRIARLEQRLASLRTALKEERKG